MLANYILMVQYNSSYVNNFLTVVSTSILEFVVYELQSIGGTMHFLKCGLATIASLSELISSTPSDQK